ncbi:hypothetical protein K8T06_14175 [bacterium]|nr:hypothetical protein [bacterium]
MDDKTRNLVASNLTVAYFLLNPSGKRSKHGDLRDMKKQWDISKKSPEDHVITVFRTLYDRLDEPNK